MRMRAGARSGKKQPGRAPHPAGEAHFLPGVVLQGALLAEVVLAAGHHWVFRLLRERMPWVHAMGDANQSIVRVDPDCR